MHEALAGDLDAYLDRELFEAPDTEAAACDTASVTEVSESLRELLALAEAETEWMEQHPRSTSPVAEVLSEPTVEIPAWMRTSPDAKQVTSLGALLLPLDAEALSHVTGAAPLFGSAPQDAASWDGRPLSAPWEVAAVGAEAPARGMGLWFSALMGAAAVGALTAGLLLVAGLSVREGSLPSATARVSHVEVPDTAGVGDSSQTASFPATAGSLAADAAVSQDTSSLAPGAVSPGMVSSVQPLVSTASQQVSLAGVVPSSGQDALREAVDGLRPDGASPAPSDAARRTDTQALAVAQPAPVARKVRTNADEAAALPDAPAAPVELAFGEAEAGGAAPGEGVQSSPGDVVADAVEEAAAEEKGPYADLDEEFARELGFTDDAEAEALKAQEPARTVYVPPALDMKEHLTPEDVKQVVVTNQPAITACLRSHSEGTAMASGGRFVVQWSVLPSGETLNVSMDSSVLRGTPLARCIEDVVRRWKFPVHQVRMQEPIRFPFIF
ncbi:AgmX/PglI C-terminal domain-containing protein [Myxococcus sp. Y35]|uniref:AgmX/PglI C-terminal domain-containing protein n=1 Tax=Pseudomyxococcus flavus TaxID=3115648 RepID=UPI003CF24396